jgi:hypothetical protein
MNIEQSLSTDNTTENGSIKKRRQFIKAAGVPVILTFSSPSVFGALCASEIASGNQSHTGKGSCEPGLDPVTLAKPINKDLWPSGYIYGSLPNRKRENSHTTTYADYTSGKPTKYKDVFGGDDETTLSYYLGSGASKPTLKACLIAAVLNAELSKNYPLTVDYVKKLESGKVGVPSSNGVVPAYKQDIITYLQQTWDSSH